MRQSVVAIDNISLSFNYGEIIGLKGHNGSGKSTLLKLIGNVISPDAGDILLPHHKNQVAYISGNDRSFFWRLDVQENLDFFGSQYLWKKNERVKKINEILDALDIAHLRDRTEDIPLLIKYFSEKISQNYNLKKFDIDTTNHYLINYDWPGNVRELRNLIERIAILGPDNNEKVSSF